MATVLVTDGEQRSALAVTRSLGRAGHTVYVCSHQRWSLAAGSRYARDSDLVPDAFEQPGTYADAVCELVRRWGIQIVIPITEPSVYAILPQRGRVEAVIPFTTLANFERICDKAEVSECARRVGIAVPRQYRLNTAADFENVRSDLTFPLVVKPTRSVVHIGQPRRTTGTHHADSICTLEEAMGSFASEDYPLLLQQRIQGPGIGVFLLLHDGDLLAAFSHRRLREKPPSGGVSVYCESIPLEPSLMLQSKTLLECFNWSGVAMVEYKVDRNTGIPYIIEINGRFWGSLQLAIDAGVDFPALLVAAALGQQPQPVMEYRPGARIRWLLGAFDHLLTRLRRSATELALETNAPSRARALLNFFTAFAGRNEVFRLSDPIPAFREALSWFRPR